jgi:hypothetical protein
MTIKKKEAQLLGTGRPWSAFPVGTSLVNADYFAYVDSTAPVGPTKNKRITRQNIITNFAASGTFILTNPSANQTIATNNLTLSAGNLILSSGTLNVTDTGASPCVNIVGNDTGNIYNQLNIASIVNPNYHITLGVDSATGLGGTFAGDAGVGFIPYCLQVLGGAYVGIGSNGKQSQLNIFPATANHGSFNLIATDSATNHVSTLHNVGVGQDSNYYLSDPGTSDPTSIIIANFSGTQQILTGNLELGLGNFSLIGNGATVVAPLLESSGNSGAASQLRFIGSNASGHPTTGTWQVGDTAGDYTGALWMCTVAGTPGTWIEIGTGTGTNYWSLSGTTLFPATVGNTVKIVADGALATPQFLITGQADATKKLSIGYDTTNNEGFIQSQHGAGPTYDSLCLNPNGGQIAVNYALGAALPAGALVVNGNGYFTGALTSLSGNFQTFNGNHIAGSAGNGSSFQSYSNDGSILYFYSQANSAIYNNIVTNASTGQNSWWQFPDPGTTAHTNVIIGNSAGTQAIATGNLSLTAGYMNFGAISLPSTPIGSVDVYSRTISGTTNLYALLPTGTEVNLTTAGSNLWSTVSYSTYTLLQPITSLTASGIQIEDAAQVNNAQIYVNSSGFVNFDLNGTSYFQISPSYDVQLSNSFYAQGFSFFTKLITAYAGINSYSPNTSNYLGISAINTTNNVTITNVSSYANATTAAIPDPGVPSTNFILTDSASTQTITSGNLSLTGAGTLVTAPALSSSGLTGATAGARLVGATSSQQPTSGTFALGDIVINQTYGNIYTCTTAGPFGAWVMASTPLLGTSSTFGLAPLTSVQVTVNLGSPYAIGILGLAVGLVEGTTNLPLNYKIVSYVVGPPSTATVEIYNLSTTLTTGTIQVKVYHTGQ